MTLYEEEFRKGKFSADLIEASKRGYFFEQRWELIQEFGFAVPNEECLDIIAKFQPILEVGSGNGYWAWELRQRGVEVVATDPTTQLKSRYNAIREGKRWLTPRRLKAEKAVEHYPHHTLMMVCPCMEPWAFQTIMNYTGKHLIFVGEDWGGCTATDAFWKAIENWEKSHVVNIPKFPAIHDYFRVYTRPEKK